MSTDVVTVSLPPCPACRLEPGSSLACLGCGHILVEPTGVNHLQRMGMELCPVLGRDELEASYLRLSRLLHPDFQTDKDAATRERALRNSALLNEAYRVLTDDQLRGEYLLSLTDPEALERHKRLDPAFLMQTMEHSEALEAAAQAGDEEALAALAAGIRTEIDERMGRVSRDWLLDEPDTDELAVLLHQVRVFRRMLRDAESAA